jgi:putative SOS response-associated peptidase YedK
VLSYAIATCDPSPYAAQIHDRMPVLVEPENAEAWCTAPPAEAVQLLRGHTGPLVARPIHRDIAVARKATAASIEAIGPAVASGNMTHVGCGGQDRQGAVAVAPRAADG